MKQDDSSQLAPPHVHRNLIYRATAKGLHGYVNPRVRIVGGLVPTTTIAAQAGSIDATTFARASVRGNEAEFGGGEIPEAHVTHVEQAPEPCSWP